MPLVQLQDGSTVQFLLPGSDGDFEAQGVLPDGIVAKLDDVARKGGQVLLEAANSIRQVLSAVAPSQLEIEIGIAIGKEGSIIVASAKAETSLKIKAIWKESRSSEK